MPPDAIPRQALFERIIARDRLIVGLCLGAAVALAWWWLWRRAMPADHVMPGMMANMPGHADGSSPPYYAATFVMWLLMMIAMMLPSATPMILFYARFARRSALRGALVATAAFATTYIAIWALFSAIAAAAQALLVSAGILSAMELSIGSRALAGGLLIAAGAYQLSPLKRACLRACRSPVYFLIAHWRPGIAGALHMGFSHGLYCLGCCWALMTLLFVGGVMNLGWVAGLAILVLFEKYAPDVLRLRSAIAAALLIAGALLISA